MNQYITLINTINVLQITKPELIDNLTNYDNIIVELTINNLQDVLNKYPLIKYIYISDILNDIPLIKDKIIIINNTENDIRNILQNNDNLYDKMEKILKIDDTKLYKSDNEEEISLMMLTKRAIMISGNMMESLIIKSGIQYRNNINDNKGIIRIPSIKTKNNIIRMDKCIILENGMNGFMIYFSDESIIKKINDLYLDKDSKLCGVYKTINTEVKIVRHNTNMVITGINNIEPVKIHYFWKISDNTNGYKISEPIENIYNIIGGNNQPYKFMKNKKNYREDVKIRNGGIKEQDRNKLKEENFPKLKK